MRHSFCGKALLVITIYGLANPISGSLAQSTDNPNYSNAIYRKSSPEGFLAEYETHLNESANPQNRFVNLPYAAKAALEAGQFQKAEAYAIEALQWADSQAEKHKKSSNPRSSPGVGTIDFYSNFVLGRLAVSRGDIRSAEMYLVAAGKTSGDAVLDSYGPNMSLANELLKAGDAQSREQVVLFLQECRVFWKIDPKVLDDWIAGVAREEAVDFKEQVYR